MQIAILSGMKSKNDQDIKSREIYRAALRFWYEEWSEIMATVEPGTSLNIREFATADYVLFLYEENETTIKPMGLHMYRYVSLTPPNETLKELSSTKFNPQFFKKIADRNIHHVLTMEYFLVHKDYRSRKSGVATIIPFVGLELLKELKLDAFITAARVSVGASKIATNMGFEILEQILLHGEQTDLLIGEKSSLSHHLASEKNEFREKGQELYTNRHDFTGGKNGFKKTAA